MSWTKTLSPATPWILHFTGCESEFPYNLVHFLNLEGIVIGERNRP